MYAVQSSKKVYVGDTDYPSDLLTSMSFGALLFFFVIYVALYLRELSSSLFAKNLTLIGLNYSEDEGGYSQRWRFQITVCGFVCVATILALDSLIVVVNGASHFTVAGSHAEIRVAVLRRTCCPGRR